MQASERRLFEYFIIAGLKDEAQELATLAHEGGTNVIENVAPITDICVIFPGIGETVPEGFECIETTPLGHVADLNHGSLRAHSAFLCYRRGYHKPPLIDLGILDDGRGESPMTDTTIIERTPYGHSANVNNTSHGLYFTMRRASPNTHPHRLVITHICVILVNKGEVPPHTYYRIEKNLNQGMVGSDVYVCYKKSQMCGKRIAYKPEVLDCFPRVERANDLALTQNVPMFCLPMGALIESWSEKCGEAEKLFSTFVLTDETGAKYYGASLTFYEHYEKSLTEAQLELLELRTSNCRGELDTDNEFVPEKATYHCNKSICIVSRYPFFDSFKRFLYFLHGMSVAEKCKLPIERYISHLMYEVHFPSPERPRVLVQLVNEMITFESYDDSQIPLSGAIFTDALTCLGSENFIYAMLLALLEQKILFHSLRPTFLTAVGETICALMFPFHWQCPYIPQCPLTLAGVLHAPLPFITGVDSRYFDFYDDLPADVTCFNLDTTTVSHSTMRKSLKLSILPKKPLKRLRASLDAVLMQMSLKKTRNNNKSGIFSGEIANFEAANRSNHTEMTIREAFLRFMCSLMAGYTRFLRPILKSPRDINATDTGALFNLEAFISSRDKNSIDFYRRFSETQCFNRFIEERCFISDKNAYNIFFDDCIERLIQEKATKKEIRLSDDDVFISNHTVVVPSPEPEPNSSEYCYKNFPEHFDYALFELDQIIKNHSINLGALNSPVVENDQIKYWLVRTKQEIKMSLKEVAKSVEKNRLIWANNLLFYAYSLWFLQLPSMIHIAKNKLKILKLAFKILCRMERSDLIFCDQVCYRTLIYLCGEYNYPQLATQVLLKMARNDIQINAVTYGIYHWALMQGDWPSDARLAAIAAWNRIRLRVVTCALFRLNAENAYANNSSFDDNLSFKSPNISNVSISPSLSSIVNQVKTLRGTEDSQSIKSGNISNVSISPSLSSIVHQVKKQALKGYDEMLQQSNMLLKKSGFNTLVAEAKSLNKSYSFRDISSMSNMSGNFSEITMNDPSPMNRSFVFSEATFQLCSGNNGDFLQPAFWLHDVLSAELNDFLNMWLTDSSASLIDITLCTASRCSTCELIIYDEELMAGWTVESGSNLNTTCPHCGHSFLPSLSIIIRRLDDQINPSWYIPMSISLSINNYPTSPSPTTSSKATMKETQQNNATADKIFDHFSVTFVSPLILRRELETLLVNDPLALSNISLRVTHPIIFWNLLYYCRRLDVPTHILTWLAANVHIRCVYDLPSLHVGSDLPVYLINHKEHLPPSIIVSGDNVILWQQIIDNLQANQLFKILQYLINYHRERKETAVVLRKHFSFYREILFTALDKFNKSLVRDSLDSLYYQEVAKLPPRIQPLLSSEDMPPPMNILACRRIFIPLDVV